ncbi:SUF system Fe-S cluster assembly regulator [Coxiella endosymbiont of Amblyomma sculptum]|uniref:SUF system Fe-S cluster assembly regulator n=1 Tax=Coxiella endosymbiont of Amblyomma sculptum TaxID=2487929 RepID=UPI00132EDAEB|nr:SUF system Fe-S cluster assembly regulator [Coxiella endosymbiont of Amblyomma sculptum]QHG92525.1 SUF system Fe-S cluster assembly regulator [Coxiella endosymbiont of Amblyomma sculptum]
MLKISRLADYATTVMVVLASQKKRSSTTQISRTIPFSPATISKILKLLNGSKLIDSERGVNGGYCLVKSPKAISIAEIITAIDGRPAITKCSSYSNRCEYHFVCGLRNNWRIVNGLVFEVLNNLSLADMKKPLAEKQIISHQI